MLETYQRLKKSKRTHQSRLNTLKENLKKTSPDKYFIKSHKEEVILSLKEIIYLEASVMYTKFYTTTNKVVVSSKPLKEILNDLPEQFLRSHRSFAFNRDNVKKPISIVNGELQLMNNQTIPISVKKKKKYFLR